jgi:hypothetical protein
MRVPSSITFFALTGLVLAACSAPPTTDTDSSSQESALNKGDCRQIKRDVCTRLYRDFQNLQNGRPILAPDLMGQNPDYEHAVRVVSGGKDIKVCSGTDVTAVENAVTNGWLRVQVLLPSGTTFADGYVDARQLTSCESPPAPPPSHNFQCRAVKVGSSPSDLNVFSPDFVKVVGTLPPGTDIIVDLNDVKSGFIGTTKPIRGYVSAAFLTSCSSPPQPPPVPVQTCADPNTCWSLSDGVGELVIRDRPDTSSRALGSIHDRDRVCQDRSFGFLSGVDGRVWMNATFSDASSRNIKGWLSFGPNTGASNFNSCN